MWFISGKFLLTTKWSSLVPKQTIKCIQKVFFHLSPGLDFIKQCTPYAWHLRSVPILFEQIYSNLASYICAQLLWNPPPVLRIIIACRIMCYGWLYSLCTTLNRSLCVPSFREPNFHLFGPNEQFSSQNKTGKGFCTSLSGQVWHLISTFLSITNSLSL
jgi:hypothetical protein